MISLSYARISFEDVAQKLQLDSPENAEYIVAKVSFIFGKEKTYFLLFRLFVMESLKQVSIMSKVMSNHVNLLMFIQHVNL
jgi:hypothetical protein